MSYQHDERRFRQDLEAKELDARFIENCTLLAHHFEIPHEGVIDMLRGRRPLQVTGKLDVQALEAVMERFGTTRGRIADFMDGQPANATDAEFADWAVQKLRNKGKLSP